MLGYIWMGLISLISKHVLPYPPLPPPSSIHAMLPGKGLSFQQLNLNKHSSMEALFNQLTHLIKHQQISRKFLVCLFVCVRARVVYVFFKFILPQ